MKVRYKGCTYRFENLPEWLKQKPEIQKQVEEQSQKEVKEVKKGKKDETL